MQERLQVSRIPLDKWTVREQLCLASAVACSGDQNWTSVSSTLKVVCENTTNTLQARPGDWFSQKNCAIQYEYLLEEIESPKRKKNLPESNEPLSPSSVESPTEDILKKLTEERMQEIKVELEKGQEEYAKLLNEIKSLQNGEFDDNQLVKMWSDIEKDQEMQRVQEMKLENQMRERELNKQELERSWDTNANTTNSLKSSTDTTTVDMDVEEIIGSGKTIIPATKSITGQMQTGTSPLLSSLLKSPNANIPAANVTSSSPFVRNIAPTITTLLTSGSIPNQNQPALIPSDDEAVQLLARPISGPPSDTVPSPASAALTLLSPSQSAPTLSMLLEKNKMSSQNASETKNKELISRNVTVVEDSTVKDSNNEPVPMDIEEDLAVTKTESNSETQTGEVDETDPNEEQQLLEVFKNIGNIDELDIDVSDVIDEEVDFLKGVDEETSLEESIDIEKKLDVILTNLAKDIKLLPTDNTPVNFNTSEIEEPSSAQTVDINNLEDNKVEIISSDDSNDNIPLAAVVSSKSSKERLINESSNEETFLKDRVESANLKNELDQSQNASEGSSSCKAFKHETLEENETSEHNNESNKLSNISDHKDDIFVAPIAEDAKQENIFKRERELNEENKQHIKMIKDENEMKVSTKFVGAGSIEQEIFNTVALNSQHDVIETSTSKIHPLPSASIGDTDENSSSTDISVQTRKDEKHACRGLRKSPHETKTDDEMPNPIMQQMATPITSNLTPRPTTLRKLRDRGRSESPMIDDDGTTHSDHSTTNQRSRRRYSSTPVIDSVPNSPASSDRDERDLRTSKKTLLSIYNVLYSSKFSGTLQKVLSDESSAQKLDEICLRSIDFLTIKKNIEIGLIRTVYELQRDILWMCQNALMITKNSSRSFKAILQFQQEFQNIKEFMPNGCESGHKFERETRDNKSNISTYSSTGGSTSKVRSGSRKSLRLS